MDAPLTSSGGIPPWPRWVFAAIILTCGAAFLAGSSAVRMSAYLGANVAAWLALALRARVTWKDASDIGRLLLPAFTVYLAANIPWYLYPYSGHVLPLPSPVDAGFFTSYVLFGLLLRRLSARYVGQDRRGWLDVVIVALGLSAPLWELEMRPPAGGGLSLAATLTLLTYPAALLVLLAMGLRLAFLTDRHDGSQLLMLVWIAGELGGDVYLETSGASGTFSVGSHWLLLFLLSWLAVGMAALQPGRTSGLIRLPAHEMSAATRLVWLGISAALPILAVGLVVHRENRLPVYALGAAVSVLALLLLRVRYLFSDFDEQQRVLAGLVEQLRNQSLRDPLTGVANRTLLHDRIDHALLQRPRLPGTGLGVLCLDMDGFKAVNDTFGHDVGDLLLVELSRRLQLVARAGDTVARMGGDEFALVLADIDAAGAVAVADRVRESLSIPADLGVATLTPSASIGIALFDGSQDRDTLLKQADVALYQAKLHAPGRHLIYSQEAQNAAVQREALSTALQGAAARGEMYLDYQPVLALADNRITGVEALVRWQHPERGLLPPLDWIPLAESNGAIICIGEWVLEEACRQLAKWDREHGDLTALDVAVNVSVRQLEPGDVVDRFGAIFARTGVDPQRVVLEVTESALALDAAALIKRLRQLSALGCRIAIDDFGTGFSSLSLLRVLPIDIVKIDKSFVDGIARESEEWALVTAIVTLAKSLGKQLVAEGIERGDQLAHLIALRCQFGQGYLFSRPVSPASIAGLLRAEVDARART